MKKAISLLVSLILVLGTVAVPVSAVVAPEANNILWDAETSEGVVLGTNTSTKDGYIFDDADWSWGYEIIGGLLPEVITGKVVNLSFDWKPTGTYWGAPSFRVHTFGQNEAYAQGSADWHIGFYAYEPNGDQSHDSSKAYYEDAKYTYYGTEAGGNTDPYTKNEEGTLTFTNPTAPVEYNTWQHIDCVYNLSQQTVTHYVNGRYLGMSKGPHSIGAIAFRKMSKLYNESTYYGAMFFDNVRLTEVKDDGLVWGAEAEASDSFLLNFSEPVDVLVAPMVVATDMETGEAATVSSVEKITAYQYRVKMADTKANAEYKIEIPSLVSTFGSTSKNDTIYANTGSLDGFGIKKVRYDAIKSNNTMTVESTHSDNFDSYTKKGNPGENANNENDYETVSNGMWSRIYHTRDNSVWFGKGSFVDSYGQLCLDMYSSGTGMTIGAVRKITDGTAVKEKLLNVEFDMGYYVAERHDGSYFTLYAGEYPIFGADRSSVYLFEEQLADEKISLGTNPFAKATYYNDRENVKLGFDLVNKKIEVDFGGVVKTANICDELAAAGISSLNFAVTLLNGVEGNGDYRGNTLTIDNYSDEIIAVSAEKTYNKGLDALGILPATTSVINVEFTDAVELATASGITITDADGNGASYTPLLSEDGKVLALAVSLKPDTSYTLAVPATVASANGVYNSRAYAFEFNIDRAVKFFDAQGAEIAESALATTSAATVDVFALAPSGTGIGAYIYAVYDKATNALKAVRTEEMPYSGGGIMSHGDTVNVADGEYAKVFVWDNATSKPVLKSYTIGK